MHARRMGVAALLMAALIASAVGISLAADERTPAPTAEGPTHDTASEWPLPNQDYRNTRAAADPVIDSGNVDELGLAWSMDIPGSGPFGAAAGGLVVDAGVVYFQDLGANVFAIVLETGEVIWEQRYDAPLVGPNGPAIGNERVFVSIDDGTFAALDSVTGEELWTVQPETGYLGAIQPSVFDGTVYYATQAGKSGEEGYAAGQSGVVHAADVETGEDRWTFQVVEDDFWGNPDVNSGGGIWYPPAIATEAGVTFWGTGNPAPFPGTEEFPNGSSRPGPNLYTSSVIALDHENGDLRWYFQAVEHDLFDHDFQVSPILARVEIDGEDRNIVIGAGKNGEVIAIDRATHEALWGTEVGRHENDDLDELPLDEEVVVYPGILGGVETPMAYADGLVYVPVVNIPTTHTATGHGAADGPEALANADANTPVDEGTGELVAIDVSNGEIVWQHEFEAPVFAGATVSGDLVFTATYDGVIHAFGRTDGELVWSYEAPGGIIAWPAIVGDTIVWPAGLGQEPQLLALRLGAGEAEEPSPSPAQTSTPEPTEAASPEPTEAASPEPTEAASPEPTEAASPEPSPDGGEQAVSPTLGADNNAFDTSELMVPAGAEVELTLVNRDPVPHNFALYRSEDASDSLFVGETFSGPDASVTYSFAAPSEPGEYFFRCDVHPTLMTGVFIVE